MDIQRVKIDIIQWLTQLNDEKVLKKILTLREEEGYELSPDQMNTLEDRLEKYERGEMNFKSWKDVKSNIKKRAKDVL